jgi:hypothetical protein
VASLSASAGGHIDFDAADPRSGAPITSNRCAKDEDVAAIGILSQVRTAAPAMRDQGLAPVGQW